MNNRLGDLPAWAMEDSDSDDDDVPKPSKNGGDIEMQDQQNNHNHYMENFFKEVDSIKADIDAVAQASKDIAKINEQSMRATTTAEEQKLSKKLKPLIDTTNKRAKRTKNLLGLLKEETEKLKAEGTLNGSDIRWVLLCVEISLLLVDSEKGLQANILTTMQLALFAHSVRENMNTTLTKKFVDEMKTYQQAQQQYKTDIKKKVKRQVQVVKPDATDEEVDAVMKSEGGRDALYKQSILAGGVNDQIK